MLKNTWARFTLLLLLAIAIPHAQADGLVYKGHISGAHTDLTLTNLQISELKHGRKSIVLTSEQKNLLRSLPRAAAVTTLSIFPSNTTTCTCELANVAVQVNQRTIEVSNRLLGRDLKQESAQIEKLLKAEKEKRFTEQHTQAGSKEIVLCDQATQLTSKDPQRAVALFEEAFKINPHLNDYRGQFAVAYNNLGIQKEQKGDLKEALPCLEKSLQYSDGPISDSVSTNINRVKRKI